MAEQDPESPEVNKQTGGPRLRRREFRLDLKTVRPAPLARWIRLAVLASGAIVAVVIYVSTMRERRVGVGRAAEGGHAGSAAKLSGTSIMWVSRPPAQGQSPASGQDAGTQTPRSAPP